MGNQWEVKRVPGKVGMMLLSMDGGKDIRIGNISTDELQSARNVMDASENGLRKRLRGILLDIMKERERKRNPEQCDSCPSGQDAKSEAQADVYRNPEYDRRMAELDTEYKLMTKAHSYAVDDGSTETLEAWSNYQAHIKQRRKEKDRREYDAVIVKQREALGDVHLNFMRKIRRKQK